MEEYSYFEFRNCLFNIWNFSGAKAQKKRRLNSVKLTGTISCFAMAHSAGFCTVPVIFYDRLHKVMDFNFKAVLINILN